MLQDFLFRIVLTNLKKYFYYIKNYATQKRAGGVVKNSKGISTLIDFFVSTYSNNILDNAWIRKKK
jgi:hypothetical protein